MASGAPFEATTSLEFARRRPPDLRDGKEIGPKPVNVDELEAAAVRALGLRRALPPQFVKGLLHRVERLASARENADLDQILERVGN